MNVDVGIFVGQRVRRRRRLMGLTQSDLGEVCGVTFQQIQKYECAVSGLSVPMLWKLACALDVEIGYFFAGLPRDEKVEQPVLKEVRRFDEPATVGALRGICAENA
jgi:transcriptional regulator with XRE-family HTH domain